jgi:hypothetical protein
MILLLKSGLISSFVFEDKVNGSTMARITAIAIAMPIILHFNIFFFLALVS